MLGLAVASVKQLVEAIMDLNSGDVVLRTTEDDLRKDSTQGHVAHELVELATLRCHRANPR
jgi:hypothetical protein